MTDDELRGMIRAAVARRLDTQPQEPRALPLPADASHYRYALPESGGPCLIEPSVPCNHCGYCQSHGH